MGVSVDPDCARYEDCLTKYPVRFQTSCEPTRKVSLAYGTAMIPETYVIDREGYIARKFVGLSGGTPPRLLSILMQRSVRTSSLAKSPRPRSCSTGKKPAKAA